MVLWKLFPSQLCWLKMVVVQLDDFPQELSILICHVPSHALSKIFGGLQPAYNTIFKDQQVLK